MRHLNQSLADEPGAHEYVGATATRAKQVIRALAKAGKNPEEELNRPLTFAAAGLGAGGTETAAATKATAAPDRVAKVATKARRRLAPRRLVRSHAVRRGAA
jgi:hypothetical protein